MEMKNWGVMMGVKNNVNGSNVELRKGKGEVINMKLE